MTSTLSMEDHHGKVSTEKEGEKEGEGIRDIGNHEGRISKIEARIGRYSSSTIGYNCAEASATDESRGFRLRVRKRHGYGS